MRIQSSIIAIATLAVLAAVITTLALSSFTAEAQGNPGAIANLQLSSTTAGTLTVSWDAASPTPTDYRVDWAKSTEDYQSWKVDDGHVYTAETVTTTTITDLSHDTEYKIRMRARYYRGEHEGKPWSGPWAEATITVAGEPAETPTPEPVQQPAKEDPVQEEPAEEDTTAPAGTIETLTGTDDNTGQLVLSWSAPAAPNATPTDYHVSWAKSSEDYPADTAEAGNAHPTTTTHTLADLEYDTDYNVRVRAHYSDGENADSPWNGPWTETTAQVLQPLPAAPIMGGTAVTPDSQVLLTWFNIDEDASITGYQILRGPEADSLAIIKDDTGSTATSYTDETPPAGQTHTYAVKARNASGLSPLSNTLTATVPAEEEEILITARHGSTGNTLVSNTGQTPSSGGAIAGVFVGQETRQAMQFTTGDNPFGYHVTNVQLSLKKDSGPDIPTPQVSIRSVYTGIPAQRVMYNFTTSSVLTSSYQLITFTTTDETKLVPNTSYFLHVASEGTSAIQIQLTASDNEDTESKAIWQIGNARHYNTDGGPWSTDTSSNLQMQISGHQAPDNRPYLVTNLSNQRGTPLFIGRQVIQITALAQSFRAADATSGYPYRFNFHGIKVQAYSPDGQPSLDDLRFGLYTDANGRTGELLYTLTPPPDFASSTTRFTEYTLEAPAGSKLDTGVTYWFIVRATEGDHRLSLGATTNLNQKQGPSTNSIWSIDNQTYEIRNNGGWIEGKNRAMNIAVLGTQQFDTLVSNIGQPRLLASNFQIKGTNNAGQVFTTGPGAAGRNFRFDGIRIIASSHVLSATRTVPEATVSLHQDGGGTPGDLIYRLSPPDDFLNTIVNKEYTLAAPRGAVLASDTSYWVVFSSADHTFFIAATTNNTEDENLTDGWSIADNGYEKFTSGWSSSTSKMRMSVFGSPIATHQEPTDRDFPGAGHNAHQTLGIVTPGIVSTGHLTPGLDYDHGHSGDYWWLDTKTGHSYRIEVKFSDSQNNDTGGSAWMSFIDPDHDDYPYASGCCEADHNRDDGHTFVHFRRPTDDWNNRYLVHIAAFDKLNHNSRTYNGPYTITMTDITGTEKVATNLYLGTRIESTLPTIDDHIQYAVSFTTGDHPGGYYKLDRVRMQVPDHQGQPDLVLHTDTSGLPGDGICDLLEPNKVQHHRPYAADNALPVPFRAAHCGRDAVLAASTTYWLVLEGDDYETVFTDSNDQQTRGSGWTIGDRAAINLAGSWESLTDNDGTIPVEIWASSTPPPNRHAAGVPLVHGERRVGETLTADITGITDPEGLSDPRFTYSWIRGDGVDEESITGEESDTYTLTDDDAGERIKTLVTFYDDDEEQETAVGPATSLIAPAAPRILVSNFNQTGSRPDTTTDISSGFVSGAHPHGYAIDSIVFRRAFTTPASSDEAEFRLYTSTSDSDARERKPDTRIMTVSGPNRVNSINIWFNPQSRVKLEPSTTYHVAFTTRTSDVIGCEAVIGGGEDSSSLAGFDILDRYYVYPDWATGLTNDQSCTIQIEGFELASSNLVQSVEFTSSPIQPDMYATGELIEATATLNQAVAFDGPPPVILLQIGDNERRMEYFTSESTDTSWVFLYRVVADDRDDEGVSTKHNALRGYADADLSHYGITNDRTRRVNAAPRVVSQRVSSTPLVQFQYGLGEKIQFTVEFSLPVTVVGNPQLEFSITEPGPDNEFMSYESGSGTRELVFSYTVVAGDNDDHGIEWDANSLQLVDGVDEIIGTYNGLDAILDHTALNQLTGHRIRQNPQVVSQEVTSDPAHGTDSDTYGAGDAITFEMVFNQAVTVTGAPRLRFSIGSRGLAADRYAAYVNGSGTNTLVFSYTVLAADADTDGIYLYDISGSPFDYPDTAIDTIVGTSNNLATANSGIGNEGRLPGHKIDGTITN